MRIKAGEVPRTTQVLLNGEPCSNVIEADDTEGWVDFLDQAKIRIRDGSGRAIDSVPRFRRKGQVTIIMPV